MDEAALRFLLDQVRSGACSPDDAVRALQRLPFADLGYARVDHHRSLRQGLPEAVYGRGKTPAQCAGIVAELRSVPHGGPVVLTLVDDEQAGAAQAANDGGLRTGSTIVWRPAPPRREHVLIVTAGTADLPVATQCQATLAAFGFKAALVADCGVAGLHRLVDVLDDLSTADAVVAVAGMEGALASVIGGLTGAPVIAVPTSAGYGAGLEGVTALLGMLASCAAGLVVVGIDNGFGAACAVARMLGPADGRVPGGDASAGGSWAGGSSGGASSAGGSSAGASSGGDLSPRGPGASAGGSSAGGSSGGASSGGGSSAGASSAGDLSPRGPGASA